MANIIFDSMSLQVQVQNETGNRLTTWTNALADAGHSVSYTDYTQPIAPQLADNDLFIVTTHQWIALRDGTYAIPPTVDFAFRGSDLGGILNWVEGDETQPGRSLLMFTNHSDFPTQPDFPNWPIFDIQLAAALGITLVFAALDLHTFTMAPHPDAPAEIRDGVSGIQSLDSGGVVMEVVRDLNSCTVLVGLPAGCVDGSPLQYNPSKLAFAVLYDVGKFGGKVIVVGHSGIVGNAGTLFPSEGQIGAADNLRFLMNCVSYLAA